MSSACEHEYAEPVENTETGDEVMQCCHCEEILGRAEPQETLPGHWFDHTPADAPYHVTARDVLNGKLPRDPSDVDRYVHVCGNCQHWLGAVHSGYFNNMTPPYDQPSGRYDRPPGFIQGLMESLCPECGAANFRQTSLVIAHSDAVFVKKEGVNLTRYVHNVADMSFWKSLMGGPGEPLGPSAVEMALIDIGNYAARCPCCGYAVRYGDREFDFHHWDYDNDVGCQLCRECHSHIHRGLRATEQEKQTDGWKRDAIERLYERSVYNGLEFNRAHEFIQRFNLRVDPELLEYIRGVVAE